MVCLAGRARVLQQLGDRVQAHVGDAGNMDEPLQSIERIWTRGEGSLFMEGNIN
jgi:hypothetical protein